MTLTDFPLAVSFGTVEQPAIKAQMLIKWRAEGIRVSVRVKIGCPSISYRMDAIFKAKEEIVTGYAEKGLRLLHEMGLNRSFRGQGGNVSRSRLTLSEERR